MLKYIKKCYYRIKCKIIKFTGGKYGEKFKKNNDDSYFFSDWCYNNNNIYKYNKEK